MEIKTREELMINDSPNLEDWGKLKHVKWVKVSDIRFALYNASINPPILFKKEIQDIYDELCKQERG